MRRETQLKGKKEAQNEKRGESVKRLKRRT